MSRNFFRHLRLFWAIAKYSFVASLEYRFRTIVRIIRIAFEGVLVIVFINSLFSYAPQVGSWDKNTVLLTFAVFQLVNAVVFFLVSGNFERLGRSITKGELDLILFKPVDPQFFVAFQRMHAQNIFRIILGLVIFVYAIQSAGLILSPVNVTIFLFLTLSSMVLYFSLLSLIATLSFWTFSDELVALTDTILTTTRYPLDVFPPRYVQLFTLIPLIFIITIPTRALLGRIDAFTIIAPVIAAVAFILSRRFFHFALRRYSSASS